MSLRETFASLKIFFKLKTAEGCASVLHKSDFSSTLQLNLERLRRHYDVVVKCYDPVSFLDLTHTLRIWTEVKTPLKEHLPDLASAKIFKTGLPARKLLKGTKNDIAFFCFMPDSVVTYASNGAVFSHEIKDDKPFTIASSIKIDADGATHMKRMCFIKNNLGEYLMRSADSERISRCSFEQWLSADAIRVNFKRDGVFEAASISREIIIKRIANVYGSSHFLNGKNDEYENKFDAPISFLMGFKFGGIPLPYFIVLKIAQDILETLCGRIAEIVGLRNK